MSTNPGLRDTAVPPMVNDKRPPMQFLDLKAQFEGIRGEITSAIESVLNSQQFILGPEVQLLEEEVARLLGAGHAVGCASGSDALYLALCALEVGSGDEVITTPFTFVATAGAIARTGARPVFADIDPDSFNIDPRLIEHAITPKTRAIIPVHLFGLPADLNPILDLAQRHRLAVIEDAAQAIGSAYGGRCVGSLGDFGCFSFFPSKNLGCAGDGGMVTTQTAEMDRRLRLLRAHGSSRKYHYEMLGTNSRLDTLQAAILRVKLRHLKDWERQRQQNAANYHALFDRYGLKSTVRLPGASSRGVHVYNQFTIRCPKRNELRAYLQDNGIPTDVYYPSPLHLQPAFSYLGYRKGDFPESERASEEVLALPIYPELTLEQQERVVGAIAEFYFPEN